MKTKFGLLVLFGTSFAAFSQQVENDDMYFNSKDRAKINAIKANTRIDKDRQRMDEDEKNGTVNPTDSYSSRNVNPEYVSRMKTNPDSQAEDAEYFISGYQPTGVNSNLYQGNYGQGSFYSPYYGNGWNSPYRYNRYGYGYGDPYSSFYGSSYGYYPSRFSMGLGYGWNAWNSGWYGNMNYGMGNMWGSPYGNYGYGNYGYYDPFNSWGNYGYSNYNSFCGYNSFYGYNNYYGGYPGTVVINNRDNYGRSVVYGKRNDRSSGLNNDVDHNRPATLPNGPGRSVSSGRTRSDVAESQQYYDRSWRRNAESTARTGRSVGGSDSNQDGGNTGSYTRPQRSTWGNGNSGNSNSGSSYSRPQRSTSSWGDGNSSGGSRSSWSDGNSGNGGSSFQNNSGGGSSGGGSRSSGGSSGGGGNSGGGGGSGGSHSRGRN